MSTGLAPPSATGLPFLLPVARAFAWIALAAWCAAFAGLLGALGAGAARLVRPRPGT